MTAARHPVLFCEITAVSVRYCRAQLKGGSPAHAQPQSCLLLLQVAKFNECVLAEASTFNATLSKWWAATPQHLQIHDFTEVNYWDTEPEDPPGLVRATFIIESKARLRAQGQYVGPLKLSDDLVHSDSE